MKCWHCGQELIWGGDHDIEDEDEEFSMVTNLSCPGCHSHIDVYYPKEKHEDKKNRIQGYYWDGAHHWVIYLTRNDKQLRKKIC